MVQFLSGSWALLLGMMLLMVGNGLQSTLLGIRGQIEGFGTWEMSIVMSAYFVGFLGGSRMAPEMIRRVGHVRVFAALASFISAVLILYPTFANPWVWTVGRIIIGFCFSGVYVTAESWLNNAATNETRGKALSLYLIVQMIGVIVAQALLVTADPSGFVLFIIPSVLVSISFAPILLSISPTPAFEMTKAMTLRELVQKSPLGTVGMVLLGGVFSAQFGMSAVYGASIDLSVSEISIFVAAFYVGATIIQYPLGWLSDRMDRRVLIAFAGFAGGVGAVIGMVYGANFWLLLFAATLVGGFSNPLYSLLIAHTNDFLEVDEMAAASGGMVFINGLGAISGPIVTGWIMEVFGPSGFFLVIAILMLGLAGYAVFRMTRREGIAVEDTGAYSPVMPSASPVALEVVQEIAIETALEEEELASESRD
ncbi:MFS transporter [Shimia thalassica]|uniref:MFS transporter n=1 Tax=Shimia thalassica TaxID=1715693 RepID=UPI001C09E44A|nr:MFS transporter [Shimia thalassica]MBU2941749.1 MFS transporter [Shimia thalassica]MDO6480579.1 MFS transporter [Shimia thalassica]MDO6483675.1 MFS transporter [Shimia thalassica]MDO6503870.1 MFS transporter [Shimia thalassica]